jgi:hypothetical protein
VPNNVIDCFKFLFSTPKLPSSLNAIEADIKLGSCRPSYHRLDT